jgi:hypothetical protein
METSHSLWNIVDDGEILEPAKGSCSSIAKGILFEISQDTDDGTFPRVSDYTRFVNKLDVDGASYFLNRCTRKKNKKEIDFMGVKIIRTSDCDTDAVLEFKEPIKVVIAKIGGEPIIQEVKKIKGEFNHDYFWTRGGRQDKLANGFEIWFNIHEYLA